MTTSPNKMRNLLAASFVALLMSGAEASAQDVIKIGALLPLSGAASTFGQPARQVMQALIEGPYKTMGGRKVELTIYDSEGNSTKAVPLLRRLIQNDKVDVVIGPIFSGESLAAVPVANEERVPVVMGGSAEAITKPITPYVFTMVAEDRLAIQATFSAIRNKGYKRIAFISANNAFGQSGANFAKALAPDFGIQLVSTEFFSDQDTNLTPQLLRINESKPEAIVSWSTDPSTSILVRNAKELGIKTPFIVGVANTLVSFVKSVGEAGEGIFGIGYAVVVTESLPDSDPRKAALKILVADANMKSRINLDFASGYGLDAFMWIDAAVKQIQGPVDREKIRAALENVSFCGGFGCRKVTPDNHRGLTIESTMVLMEIKQGKWQLSASK